MEEAMTTRTKWLIAAGVIVAAGVLAVGVVVVGWSVLEAVPPANLHLPVYQLDQVDSTHQWYRRTTVKLGAEVYVQDYEDYGLQLANPDPKSGIGRPSFGNSLMCSIPGESPSQYVAVDCGSEMPAYEVFRNVKQPVFDWRHAKYRSMVFSGAAAGKNGKQSTDAAVMAEVVETLVAGTPTTATFPVAEAGTNVCNVCLFSDELPGIGFCPRVYWDASGAIYLAESMGMEPLTRGMKFHARWIPAGALFTAWVKAP
jgi:hypothetical protein